MARPQHILVVEDGELAADALRLLLESTGRRVTTAATVAAARSAIDRDPPDVVLLDLTLPDGDGLSVAGHARALEQPPVVFAMTGHDDAAVAAACRAAGCRDVLVKPVPTRRILSALDALWRPLHG